MYDVCRQNQNYDRRSQSLINNLRAQNYYWKVSETKIELFLWAFLINMLPLLDSWKSQLEYGVMLCLCMKAQPPLMGNVGPSVI